MPGFTSPPETCRIIDIYCLSSRRAPFTRTRATDDRDCRGVKLRRYRIVGASAGGSPISRPKSQSSTNGFGRETEFANRDRRDACVDPSLSVARLSKSEVGLPKREVSGVRCASMRSTSDVPCLRSVRGQPSFDAGTNVVPALLGRTPMTWKTPKIGNAGGHGNQHVRLRGASIDASKRSARLRQQLVAAGRASCTIRRKFSSACSKSKAWICQRGQEFRRPPERDPVQSSL